MYVVISEASIGQIKLVQIIHSSRLLYILDVEMAMNDIYCPIRTRIECDRCGFCVILWLGGVYAHHINLLLQHCLNQSFSSHVNELKTRIASARIKNSFCIPKARVLEMYKDVKTVTDSSLRLFIVHQY